MTGSHRAHNYASRSRSKGHRQAGERGGERGVKGAGSDLRNDYSIHQVVVWPGNNDGSTSKIAGIMLQHTHTLTVNQSVQHVRIMQSLELTFNLHAFRHGGNWYRSAWLRRGPGTSSLKIILVISWATGCMYVHPSRWLATSCNPMRTGGYFMFYLGCKNDS